MPCWLTELREPLKYRGVVCLAIGFASGGKKPGVCEKTKSRDCVQREGRATPERILQPGLS